jgi:predicted DNA-binding transcriptional regulator YafY
VARNDRLARQWHLVQRLGDSRRGLTLEELAAGIPAELSRHLRTIRRDLEALERGGFPLLTERTDGRTRWRLVEGFRAVPAIGFSPGELMALAFSRDLLRPLQGTPVRQALDSAFTKVAAALPPASQELVRQMQGHLSARYGPHKSYREHRETIERLSRAIAERRTVQMRYFTAARGVTTRRDVDPYHLWYAGGGLYLIGHDHRRGAPRTFAVERIRSLTVTDHPYQLPLGFDVEAYVRDALVVMRGRPVIVELELDRRTAAWARDRQWHPSQRATALPGGRLALTLQVAETPELVGWILSLGRGARVVRPASLRARVAAEARAIAEGGGDGRPSGVRTGGRR